MNGMDKALLVGKLISLTSIEVERDAEVEARWTHDSEYLQMLGMDLVRPLSPAHLKKKYEALEKKMEESGDQFYFAIRLRDTTTAESQDPKTATNADRLVGFSHLSWISWNHGSALLRLGIGDQNDRNKGYGSEALALMLDYVFNELNLFRLSAVIPAYNQVALHLFERAGFVEEARLRQALHRYGRRWDLLHTGILRTEWEERHEPRNMMSGE